MIKNILFDMGNVLIRWEPSMFLDQMDLTKEDYTLLLNEVFRSVGWVQLDRGTVDDAKFLEMVRPNIPERLHAAAEQLVSHWDEPYVVPMEGMEEVVAALSENGYGLYLLSNASLRHPQYWPGVSVSKYFGDHLLISAFIKSIKPEPAFYKAALEKFSLDPGECIFIDDSPLNVEGAMRCGIQSIVFHKDAELLKTGLRELGIRI